MAGELVDDPFRPDTTVADEESNELGRIEPTELAKESWVDGDAVPTAADDGGAREAGGHRESQEDLGEVPIVEPRRGIGGNGRWRQTPLFATHLRFFEGKRRLANLASLEPVFTYRGYMW
jgi:hypothetical protein